MWQYVISLQQPKYQLYPKVAAWKAEGEIAGSKGVKVGAKPSSVNVYNKVSDDATNEIKELCNQLVNLKSLIKMAM